MDPKSSCKKIPAEEVHILNRSGPVKLIGLIAGIALSNIAVLSPGLLGLQIVGGSTLETASGVTLLFTSLLVVLYGSYTLLFKTPATPSVRNLETRDDYIAGLSRYRNVKALQKDVLLALEQLERIDKKKSTLMNILGERFEPTELSFRKFQTVIVEVEKLLYLNVRGILNKLSVFDASEFNLFTSRQRPKPFSDTLVQRKNELYNEYFAHVTGYLGANEEILLKLDQLLLEISLLDNTDYRAVDEMPCMKELNALIGQTKLYQN
ncbi:hypothetical protein [Paenibacillus sp. P32E]|uniref:hypothetical protein n=1 Tax=Paenibacillus sp. P32E TaxID=1349434 RepID=UPI0021167ED8|nr:hypothetical protein [Paenibacillus sp. P32E]